jgi:hypothetical protein
MEKRISTLEAAADSTVQTVSVIFLVPLVATGEPESEPSSASVGGEVMYRLADESADEFTDRVAVEAKRRSPGKPALVALYPRD